MVPCSTFESKQLPHSKTRSKINLCCSYKVKRSVGLRQNPSFLSLCSVLGADWEVQELRVKCCTLHALMLILKEAISAPSAFTSASVSCLWGRSRGGEGLKRCRGSHLPCSSGSAGQSSLPQLGPPGSHSLLCTPQSMDLVWFLGALGQVSSVQNQY